ncbi:DUF998 domain-containing protein [Streptomyces chartreusis]|uniref:DUF998 domain-containing protein n=1 Tax=Streptomyces chartreusis TaxID=1969 RepID=UPI00382A8882
MIATCAGNSDLNPEWKTVTVKSEHTYNKITERERLASRLGLIAKSSAWSSLGIVAGLDLFSGQLDPAADMVSEYALGGYAGLTYVVFTLIASAAFFIACAFAVSLPHTRARTMGVSCLLVVALGVGLLPFFPTDPDIPTTSNGILHASSALTAMAAFMTGVALLSRVDHVRRLSSLARTGLACSAAMALSFALMLTNLSPGLAERVLIAAGLIWVIVVSSIFPRKVGALDAVHERGD